MAEKSTPVPWYEGMIPDRSLRSIFRWGAPDQFKHPNKGLVALMQQRLGVPIEQLQKPVSLGLDPVGEEVKTRISKAHLKRFSEIVGEENVQLDTYSRLRASYGQGLVDAIRLREGVIENLPDVVLHPPDKSKIAAIVEYCHSRGVPMYVVSGRSSVTRGYEAVKGGVTIDISTHMNNVIRINRINQTVTVQPGIFGPALEAVLNEAGYTCGHFPQSFEFSTVGGWVSARSAGQNSTYYGKIEDLIISQEYITPVGTIHTGEFPRQATGPDLDQMLIGSEGIFGVLVEVTMKIHKFSPENCKRFSYMFKTWEDAQAAGREVLQMGAGMPSVFRISDPEETDVAMHLYGVAGTPAESILSALGFKSNEKCLMLGTAEGEKGFARNLNKKIRQVARKYGAFPLTGWVVKRWEHSRFLDPYMRDDLADFGVIIDTLECAVTWETLPKVHSSVREVVKARPETICMTHMSHFYSQGANLYFIFITRYVDYQDYLRLQYSILDAIQANGASMSHHHGVGKQLAPWLPGQIGEEQMAVLRALKRHFDPKGIMNPGGTLALDMNNAQKKKKWGLV